LGALALGPGWKALLQYCQRDAALATLVEQLEPIRCRLPEFALRYGPVEVRVGAHHRLRHIEQPVAGSALQAVGPISVMLVTRPSPPIVAGRAITALLRLWRSLAARPLPVRVHLDFGRDFILIGLDLIGNDLAVMIAIEPHEETVRVCLHFICRQNAVPVAVGLDEPARDWSLAGRASAKRFAHRAHDGRPWSLLDCV